MKGTPITLVKVGGAVVEDENSLQQFLSGFTAAPGSKLLVHGGGRTATDTAARLGIPTQMVAGRRITDAAMLRVVTMVYGGLVNKHIVARLQSLGTNAIGLTGADIDLVRAHKRVGTAVDYGFVGDIDHVDAASLGKLLSIGLVPVIAPLSHDGKGSMLNTNADTMASEVAKALAQEGYEVTLVFCFELPGVLSNPSDPRSVIPHIGRAGFHDLVARGVVSGGMIPKIENALRAIESGVRRVVITSAITPAAASLGGLCTLIS